MRNLLSAANHRHRHMIAAWIRTVFTHPDPDSTRRQPQLVPRNRQLFRQKIAFDLGGWGSNPRP
jgi:hypothetical protein